MSDTTNGRAIPPGQRSSRRPIGSSIAPPGARPVQLKPVTRQNADLLTDLILGKPSALLSSARLERQQPYFERCVGAALLGLSIAGTVALFQQRWGMPHLGPLAAGVALQGIITYVEWAYRRRRLSKPYIAALVIDVGLSVGGYLSIVLPAMRRLFTAAGFGATMAGVGAWLFILAAAGFLAYIPERILVKD